jgi:hypothetical protein
MMDNDPYAFVMHHREKDLKPFLEFKHRPFYPSSWAQAQTNRAKVRRVLARVDHKGPITSVPVT